MASQTEIRSIDLHNMEIELDKSRLISDFPLQLVQQLAPFCEESLKNDQFVKFYSGLPNILV